MENFTIPNSSSPPHITELPKELPILPLPGVVMFPLTIIPLVVPDPIAARMLHEVSTSDRLFAIFTLVDPEQPPSTVNLHTMGTLVYLHRFARNGADAMHIVVQGQVRVSLQRVVTTEPFMRAEVAIAREDAIADSDIEGEALVRNLRELFATYIELSTRVPEDVASKISAISDARQLVYAAAASLSLDAIVAQEILSLNSVKAKIARMLDLLRREIEVLEVGQRIRNRTQSELERSQREYLLRQQMRAIQEELGEGDDDRARVAEFQKKIAAAMMPEEAQREALRELARFEQLTPQSPEYATIEHYLDWDDRSPLGELVNRFS